MNRNRKGGEKRVEPHDSLDDFPTPPWAARALCEHLSGLGFDLASSSVWEPAVNRGAFARGVMEYFGSGYFSDVFDYGFEDFDATIDFTMAQPGKKIDFVATNPPFRLAEEFVQRALQVAEVGCAFIVRNAFVEGEDRYLKLYRDTPPTQLLFFAERVVMLKGRLVRANEIDPVATRDKGKEVRASTNRATMAAIWLKDREPLAPAWVQPGTRLRLEREGDYDL